MERFVGLFDVLGFKSFILENLAHGVPTDVLLGNFSGHVVSWFQDGIARQFGHFADLTKHHVPSLPELEFIYFSDTFLVYSPDAEFESLVAMVTGCAGLIFCCLSQSYPIRGAITKGELEVDQDRKVFLGEAIIRANCLHEMQNWCGAVMDSRVCEGPHRKMIRYLQSRGLLVDYPVPWKTDAKTERQRQELGTCLALGWPRIFGPTMQGQYIDNWLSYYAGVMGDLGNDKKENTREYWKHWTENVYPEISKTPQYDLLE